MLLRDGNLFAAELFAFSMALCLNERGSEVTSHILGSVSCDVDRKNEVTVDDGVGGSEPM